MLEIDLHRAQHSGPAFVIAKRGLQPLLGRQPAFLDNGHQRPAILELLECQGDRGVAAWVARRSRSSAPVKDDALILDHLGRPRGDASPSERWANLPEVLALAKYPNVAMKATGDYGVDVAPRLKVLKVTEPAKRSAGIKVETAADIVSNLKTAGVF